MDKSLAAINFTLMPMQPASDVIRHDARTRRSLNQCQPQKTVFPMNKYPSIWIALTTLVACFSARAADNAADSFRRDWESMKSKSQVVVSGRVNVAGRYTIPDDKVTTVLKLVELAGGFGQDAARTGIKVTRGFDQIEIFFVDAVDGVEKERKSGQPFQLRPGDIVYVPRSTD